MIYVKNSSTDPAFNLALEETLLLDGPLEAACLMLWQNRPAVIIGRNQRLESEIDLEAAARDGVEVKRRITGGGAVYHDEGNINFSLIRNARAKNLKNAHDFTPCLIPVCRALKKLGVNADISGRNDIGVAGRKVSGCAQIIVGDRILCHGTLLVASSIGRMARYLRPTKLKIQAHGVRSVRSRVGNISDYWNSGATPEILKKYLVDEFAASFGANASSSLTAPLQAMTGDMEMDSAAKSLLRKANVLARTKYCDDAWNFGRSFQHTGELSGRFPFGEVNLRWRVEEGRIISFAICGDFFCVGERERLAARLRGIGYNRQSIRMALKKVDFTEFFAGCDPAVMLAFFTQCAPF